MKKTISFIALIIFYTLTSCTKDNPTPEIDQEELGKAVLTFTTVEKVHKDGTISYQPIENEAVETIEFKAPQFVPSIGTHLHLEVGHTYKLELKSYDFANREVQETFLNKPENHQAFLLNAPAGSLSFEYGESQQVGIIAYVTVLQATDSFVMRYIMRHLNNGVKQNIKTSDWNNLDFAKFGGANDLDLKFDTHLIDGHAHGH